MTLDPRSSVETIFQAALQAVDGDQAVMDAVAEDCLLYTSPSPRDRQKSSMPSSA